MTRLQAELQRLFVPPADGRVRAMKLEVAGPAGWPALSAAWQGVQADLDLPAPAIAVNGTDAHQLWFSLAEPVGRDDALAFLAGLRRRYLAAVAPERIRIAACASDDPELATLPPREAAPERWSAFLAPDLAALFSEDACLDLPPGADAQAELLSRIASAKPQDFQRALQRLSSLPLPPAGEGRGEGSGERESSDPRRFLLDIMNDSTVALHLRIDAAKALLPYSDPQRTQ
ncbi:MAG TPA: hypothetical protein VHL79_05630 [Ramlibacter sp.]|jgi:hypothetical protein|nr:hypothetical protein [Ramlibacter sp.]